MGLPMCVSLHLEADPIQVNAVDLADHRVGLLQFSAESYGELSIFFPYENIEKVREIARLIREAATPPKHTMADTIADVRRAETEQRAADAFANGVVNR